MKTQNKIQEQDHTPCNFFLELDTKKIRVEKRENGRRKAGGWIKSQARMPSNSQKPFKTTFEPLCMHHWHMLKSMIWLIKIEEFPRVSLCDRVWFYHTLCILNGIQWNLIFQRYTQHTVSIMIKTVFVFLMLGNNKNSMEFASSKNELYIQLEIHSYFKLLQYIVFDHFVKSSLPLLFDVRRARRPDRTSAMEKLINTNLMHRKRKEAIMFGSWNMWTHSIRWKDRVKKAIAKPK